ncbi:molybdenum hydroxylase, partial [Casaltella massiliensis]|nr:molybdenum hydroxylase [Casaltella massiliensis]
NICDIGDLVYKNQVIAKIENGKNSVDVLATMDGIIRGIIRNNSKVKKNLKIADIDPRKSELKNCETISDKARCIAGGVLEAV